MDDVTGLYYAQAREYDARVGRFVGVDIILGYVMLPQSLNRYIYCLNRPLQRVDKNGLDSYVFYLHDDRNNWTSEAKNTQQKLADELYGGDISKVHIERLQTPNDLKNAWNDLDASKANTGTLDTVVINTHANASSLHGNSPTTIGSDFNNVSINSLILYGCNAGHLDYSDNPASAFAGKTNGAPVIAADGTVYSHGEMAWLDNLFGHSVRYTPKADDSFKRQLNNGFRLNEGWILYVDVNGEVKRYKNGSAYAEFNREQRWDPLQGNMVSYLNYYKIIYHGFALSVEELLAMANSWNNLWMGMMTSWKAMCEV